MRDVKAGPSGVGRPRANGAAMALSLGALGIVYGDIGTSPLYALKVAIQGAAGNGAPTAAMILGVLSLILWSLLLIVSLKYALLILRADNAGEGGIVAMLALLNARDAPHGSWRAGLLILGLIGAALLYGDGAITPAISVLSAVEGLKVDAPELSHAVVPITVAILIGLFCFQWKGTGFIGRIFGPVMLVWFLALAVLGLVGVMQAPKVLEALNPAEAIGFLLHAPLPISFAVLGAVFLAVTGGEAMYADMGHFGRFPIRLAWFGVVLPCLVLNYFGQGALLLRDPAAINNPFFQLAPDWLHYPLVVFATAATVIASQAIISGAFSLTHQSIQLGLLPRLHVRHTAQHERGQIYVPLVNWLLAAATLGAVLAFRSSDALAGAYGIAVSALMAISTFLAALVALKWGINPIVVALVNGFFLVIDLVFFSANAVKLLEGGWFPLTIAAIIAFLMLTWRRGIQLTEVARTQMRQPEDGFIEKLRAIKPYRLPGTAAFLTASAHGIPLSLTQQLRHNRVLQERVVLITVLSCEEPFIAGDARATVTRLGEGVERVTLLYGFMETSDIPEGLRQAATVAGFTERDLAEMTYYVGRETIIPTARVKGMAVWREGLFAAMQRNAGLSAAYFCIPTSQAVEIGYEIEI
jgi:KUP system potassium uptake protein